jgi:hypothetical protein
MRQFMRHNLPHHYNLSGFGVHQKLGAKFHNLLALPASASRAREPA